MLGLSSLDCDVLGVFLLNQQEERKYEEIGGGEEEEPVDDQ